MGLLRRDPAHVIIGSALSPHVARGITAAAVRITPVSAGGMRRLVQPWQQRALSYYDLVGEAWFASQFYARALSQIRFYPGVRDEAGEVEETEDPALLELFGRVQDPGGGTTQIKSQYGRLMFLTGEGFLLVTNVDGLEQWEFVSGDELRITPDGKYARYTAPNSKAEELDNVPDESFEVMEGEAMAYRMWRRHPRYSALADAPMHGVLDLFEELLLLQMAVRARVKSRLAGSGMLVISDEVSFPSVDTGEPDDDPKADPLMRSLIEHMTAPIADEGTASAVVPHLLRLPTNGRPIDDLLKLVKFHDPNETYRESGLRLEAIQRIAIGLDMPPEILTGLSDSNHWTAWQIDEQVAKAHIYPVAQAFCDDFTSAYLRPAARAEGVSGWEQVVVGYDPADLVVHPDRGENAQQAHDREVISDQALREALGFSDEDAPDEAELEARRTTAPVADPNANEDGTGDDVDEDAPAQQPAALREAATADTEELAKKRRRRHYIEGAAEAGVERAREVAGARLRGRVQRTEAQEAVQGVGNAVVAHTLSEGVVRELGVTPTDLVAGGSAAFARIAVRMGLTNDQAMKLGTQVEAHAARTLFDLDAPPLPPGFATYLQRLVPDE